MTIKLKGYILVPNEDLSHIQAELPTHIKLTRAELGCRVFSVNQSELSLNRYDVYEEFTDRDAFESHQARVKASHWGKITINAERHYQISEEAE